MTPFRERADAVHRLGAEVLARILLRSGVSRAKTPRHLCHTFERPKHRRSPFRVAARVLQDADNHLTAALRLGFPCAALDVAEVRMAQADKLSRADHDEPPKTPLTWVERFVLRRDGNLGAMKSLDARPPL